MRERTWLNKSTMKTRMLFAVTLSAQLLLGATASYGQTSNRPPAVLKRNTNVSNAGTNRSQEAANKGADTDRDYLNQIRNQAAQCAANTVVATNDAPTEIGNLEWTGQYANASCAYRRATPENRSSSDFLSLSTGRKALNRRRRLEPRISESKIDG